MIVALVALFAALGGTAVATRYLVTSPKQLKPGVITERLLAHSVRVKLARVGNTGNTGPAGPVGPKGAKGDQGEQGPIGPSAGYSASGVPADLPSGLNPVASVDVPAGNYLVHANVDLTLTTGAGPVTQQCQLDVDNGSTVLEQVAATIAATNTEVVIPLDGATTLSAAGTLHLECTKPTSKTIHVNAARLTAVKLGSLNP